MGIGKSPIEALREWWNDRAPLRATYGDPALSRAVILCHRLEDRFRIPGMKELADRLVQGRSGEQGWASEVDIRAVEAASEKGMTVQATHGRREE